MERLSFIKKFDSVSKVVDMIDQMYELNRNMFPSDFRNDIYLSTNHKSKKNKIYNFSFYRTEKTEKNFKILEESFAKVLSCTKCIEIPK